MRGFHYRKKSEALKSMLPFTNFDIPSLTRKSKKKIKSHSRNTSFKSMDCHFKDITTLFGYKKNSVSRHSKREKDDNRFLKSKKKSRSNLKFSSGDNKKLMSKMYKYSIGDRDKLSYRKHVFSSIEHYCDSIVNFTKSDLREFTRLIFDFFSKKNSKKKKSASCQTEDLKMDDIKLQAKRLIVNTELKMPENNFENTLLLLCQKEILLDEILAILNEEDIDLNNLLSITLERIEANHYEPPTDVSLVSGVSLMLEDRLVMPTPKWEDKGLRSKLKIDLSSILITENNASSRKNNRSLKLKSEKESVKKEEKSFNLKNARHFLNQHMKSKNKSTDYTGTKMGKVNNINLHTPRDEQFRLEDVETNKERKRVNISPIETRGKEYEDNDNENRYIDFGFGENNGVEKQEEAVNENFKGSEMPEGWSI